MRTFSRRVKSILIPQVYKFEEDRKAFWKVQVSQNDKLMYFSLSKMKTQLFQFFPKQMKQSYIF